MSFIEEIKERAKSDVKTIVLPEANDLRILKAAETVLTEDFAHIVLLGKKEEISKLAEKNGIDISKAKIEDPEQSKSYDIYAQKLYELRQHKGMTLEKSKELLMDSVYFGMMMLKSNEVDGLVSGAIHSTSDTLRPALQILKTSPDTKLVSTFFVMEVPNCEYGENGLFFFADCGLNQNPNEEELANIAISTNRSFKKLTEKEPKVAMLSYSTHGSSSGSSNSELIGKIINATKKAKEMMPEIIIDGELQLDTAIVPEVAKIKAPDSCLKGRANILIFPDLNSGNIGYKLVQRLAKANAYGPLCQGIARPVNDLSRGCTAEDVVGVIAITAVQAQNI